jgi:two-component system NtrC family sensor kinase
VPGMPWKVSLATKILATVCGVATISIGLFAWMTIRAERAARVDLVIRDASQFSDTVKRSIHSAMLKNRWQDAFEIMDAIGKQEGVDRVRVFTKEGAILFSTDRSEIGGAVDKRAESCYACHAAERPLERLNLPDRARIFPDRAGHRLLGMITPLYNEPGCSKGCHVHPATKQVLGVLDIALSLAKVDEDIALITRRTAVFAGIIILSLALLLTVLVRRGVLRPVRELVEGTRRVALGGLDYRIPVRSADEVGELAASFNRMTEALGKAQGELTDLVGTLEQRVEERTRELRETQAQLIQTEKLASLGRLSASIAHEINNPLSGILTYAKLISRKLRGGQPSPDDTMTVLQQLALVERETVRCTTIVRNLLDFARQRPPSFQEVDVLAVLDEALSLVVNRMEIQHVEVIRELAPVPPVWADFGQLRQAVVNILINACDAMPKGGKIRLITRQVDAGRAAEAPGQDGEAERSRQYVEMGIVDRGEGIAAEHLSRIFDPFFSTKERGTGLGLSVVYGILEKHGGKVLVDSRVGEGTTITLRLPVATARQA